MKIRYHPQGGGGGGGGHVHIFEINSPSIKLERYEYIICLCIFGKIIVKKISFRLMVHIKCQEMAENAFFRVYKK